LPWQRIVHDTKVRLIHEIVTCDTGHKIGMIHPPYHAKLINF
jgi:hypothetical protein